MKVNLLLSLREVEVKERAIEDEGTDVILILRVSKIKGGDEPTCRVCHQVDLLGTFLTDDLQCCPQFLIVLP